VSFNKNKITPAALGRLSFCHTQYQCRKANKMAQIKVDMKYIVSLLQLVRFTCLMQHNSLQPTLTEPDVPAQQQHQQHQQNEKTRLGTRERNIMYPMWLRCCSTTTSTCDVHIGIAHDKRDDIVHFAQRPTKFYLADAQQTLDGRTVTKISYQQQQQ
jgi:hypothetical protein